MTDTSNTYLAIWRTWVYAMAAVSGDTDGENDSAHLDRVWRNAQALLAHHPGADRLVVLAACYLHDLVNLPKNDPERDQASRRSARLARHRLAQLDFPPDKLDAVAHAIEAHSFSAAIRADTIESKIVQDADRLDGLGLVGLARMFYIAGRMESALAHPGDPLAAARELDDRSYALDHIMVKLRKLPAMMQTAAGRELGLARLDQLLVFREQFAAEWSGAGVAPG
jgi:uncharacterized protein